ncbi:MAG: HAD family hydrolase [Bacillota bacterium]
MAKTVDAVLFDLDGTLLDTTKAILASLRHTVEYFTGTIPPTGVLQKTMGIPLVDVLESLLPGRTQEALQVYVDHNLRVHKDFVKPYPGVIETLNALKSGGIRLGLVTSKRRHSAQVGLKSACIGDSFEAIVCHDDTDKHKPDPTPLLMALESMGIASGTVLMVGDTIFDIRAAKNADGALPGLRVKSGAVTYGGGLRGDLSSEEPDFLFDDIREVLTACGISTTEPTPSI